MVLKIKHGISACKNKWLNPANIFKFLKELKHAVCVFMQKRREYFVTEYPSIMWRPSYLGTCGYRGMVPSSSPSSNLICPKYHYLLLLYGAMAGPQHLPLSIQGTAIKLLFVGERLRNTPRTLQLNQRAWKQEGSGCGIQAHEMAGILQSPAA